MNEVCGCSPFVCSLCGKTVLAEVTVHKDGVVEIKQESAQIRGGLGNRVLYDNVCVNCLRKIENQTPLYPITGEEEYVTCGECVMSEDCENKESRDGCYLGEKYDENLD